MFHTFYQLREQPFGVNPDPRFLYLSKTHREAFSSLLYRVQTDSGFLAMIAEPGMGKTTLLFHLLHRLQGKAKTAFIFQTQCSSHELLRHLLSEFECDTSITDPVRMSQELKSLLVAEANAGRRCLLIVDEAQNLAPEVLETIRLLSNFETPRRKLLNIILSGQAELGEMLGGAQLRQLRQRLSCMVYLQRFTPSETALYIAHRLETAGYRGKAADLFSLAALTRIAQVSEGIPRVINNLCFNALSLGFALEARRIDLAMVEEVACDLGLSLRPRSPSPEEEAKPDAEAMSEHIPAVTAVGHGEQGQDQGQDEDAPSAISAAFEAELPEAPGAVDEVQPAGVLEFAAWDRCADGSEPEANSIDGAACERPTDALEEAPNKVGDAEAELEPTDPWLTAAVNCSGERTADGLTLAGNEGTKQKLGTIFLMRTSLCLLLFCIVPGIYFSARHNVSARSAKGGPGESAIEAKPKAQVPMSTAGNPVASVAPVVQDTTPKASPAVASKVENGGGIPFSSPRRNVAAKRTGSTAGNKRMLVDLALASFAPEPLMQPLPMRPMRLSPPGAPPDAEQTGPAIVPAAADLSSTRRRSMARAYVPPKAIWQPAPEYPKNGRRLSGPPQDVDLLLSVTSSGDVSSVGVLKGNRALAAAAMRAVKGWIYSPALSHGVPVDSQVYITVQFRQQ